MAKEAKAGANAWSGGMRMSLLLSRSLVPWDPAAITSSHQPESRGLRCTFSSHLALGKALRPVNQMFSLLPPQNREGKTCCTLLLARMGKRSSIYFPLPHGWKEEERRGCGRGERRDSMHRDPHQWLHWGPLKAEMGTQGEQSARLLVEQMFTELYNNHTERTEKATQRKICPICGCVRGVAGCYL